MTKREKIYTTDVEIGKKFAEDRGLEPEQSEALPAVTLELLQEIASLDCNVSVCGDGTFGVLPFNNEEIYLSAIQLIEYHKAHKIFKELGIELQ